MAIRIIIIICSCMFLVSCTVPYDTVMKDYYEKAVCCKGFEEFEYEEFPKPDSKSFMIDNDSSAFKFDTGKSYFKGFRLPEYTTPYYITIKSFILGDNIEKAYILRPVVMFLDNRYNVTRVIDDEFHFIRKHLVIQKRYEAKISITNENANERYMIILTTDKLLKENVAVFIPDVSTTFYNPEFDPLLTPSEGYSMVVVPHSPVGKLKLIVNKIKGDK